MAASSRIAGLVTVSVLLILAACGGGDGPSSSAGSTSVTLKNAAIAYPSTYYAYTAGLQAQTVTPTVTGATFTSWSVTPALPAGLVLSASTGSISGQPTTAAAATNYVITGTNSEGHQAATLIIAVSGAPLLDLGLASPITLIRYANSSVLSQDDTSRWLLQDYSSGATLASGGAGGARLASGAGYVDLQQGVMIDEAEAGLEVRSATSGDVLATIPYPTQVSWFRLATDGSYISAGSPTALTAWSTSGQMLVSLTGNYSQAAPFAAPGQIQIALGPAGQNVIQTVSIPSGASSTSPAFQGVFASWFFDGQRFLTNEGTTVWTYSNAAVQQNLTAVTDVTGLAGEGNWFWTFDPENFGGGPSGVLNVYQVGSNAGPVLTTPSFGIGSAAIPSGTTIGVLPYGYGQVTIVDLSGATPVVGTAHSVPYAQLTVYAAQSASEWLVGNANGVVFDGASLASTPRSLTLGTAWSVAAGTSFISVSTASGKIFYFNASNDTQVGTINFSSSQLSASSDGMVLAAAANSTDSQYETDRTLNLYALPSGSTTNSFVYSYPDTTLSYMTMSGSATTVAERFDGPTTACLTQVIPVAGGAPILCDNTGTVVDVQLAPNGTLIATSTEPSPTVSSNIYLNGTLVTAVPGYAVGWLDNDRLLVNMYVNGNDGLTLNGAGTTIFDAAGTKLGTTPLGTMDPFQVVSGATNSVYDKVTNTIVSLTSGDTTWASGDVSTQPVFPLVPGNNSGVTGAQVIFVSNNFVLAQPY